MALNFVVDCQSGIGCVRSATGRRWYRFIGMTMFNLALRARPYFGALVLTTALLVLGGVYGAMHMPSGVYPEVTFPRIAVVARKPGLDVRSMELQITIPLEQAVRTVLGVARVRSSTI